MESYLYQGHYDLITPDGTITQLKKLSPTSAEAIVSIDEISPFFVGFEIDHQNVFFNIKSTLAQVGLNAEGLEYCIDPKRRHAQIKVLFTAIGELAIAMLDQLEEGTFVGKLFAADERRCVRDPDYLARMFGRSDRWGEPLLSLGGMQGSSDLILEKIDGRTIAYLTLKNGCLNYENSIVNFLPTMSKALKKGLRIRDLLRLHQTLDPNAPRCVENDKILLVKTLPLHIRTAFGLVVNDLLAQGFKHTTANVLQPDTKESGDIYELYGNSQRELTDIPLEFYTLEPHREHVFFQDRDQLQSCIENSEPIFKAFETAPLPLRLRTAVFVVKGEQLLNLTSSDWVKREPKLQDFPGVTQGARQALMVDRYIQQQPCYPFLKSMTDGLITSQGILLSRYFPSPLMKRMLLSDQVHQFLKGLYFQYPSTSSDDFFSHEDRAVLLDLAKFAIPVYWADQGTNKILQYVHKPGKDSGMFVPPHLIPNFLKSTVFGIYGSNLMGDLFEETLICLFKGILKMKEKMTNPLLNKNTPLTLITGGGPGAMEVGNRVAKSLNILSCANIADFRSKDGSIVNEQIQNPYVEAKMTYRLDKLVERQAEFHLDFPIFLKGGIGTDFEYSLEEVRRKVGSALPNPILLFGEVKYWKQKISTRYLCNLESGTIAGSEWISNCFFCVQTAEQGLSVYQKFFEGSLPIGKSGPSHKEGFVIVSEWDT